MLEPSSAAGPAIYQFPTVPPVAPDGNPTGGDPRNVVNGLVTKVVKNPRCLIARRRTRRLSATTSQHKALIRLPNRLQRPRMSPTSDDSSVLDLDHLSRQTVGDRALEGELLALFEAQCARLRPLLAAGRSPGERADAAHTLKGSARAIGAW